MKDDNYSGDLHAWIEPEIEARVVALILGEASEFETEELERLMEERPEIRIFKRRLEAVHGLVGEALQSEEEEEWQLPASMRAELLETFGAKPEGEEVVLSPKRRRQPDEREIRRAGRRVLWGAAACLAITLFLVVLAGPALLQIDSEKSGEAPLRFGDHDFADERGRASGGQSATPQRRMGRTFESAAHNSSYGLDGGGTVDARSGLEQLRANLGDDLAVLGELDEREGTPAYGIVVEEESLSRSYKVPSSNPIAESAKSERAVARHEADKALRDARQVAVSESKKVAEKPGSAMNRPAVTAEAEAPPDEVESVAVSGAVLSNSDLFLGAKLEEAPGEPAAEGMTLEDFRFRKKSNDAAESAELAQVAEELEDRAESVTPAVTPELLSDGTVRMKMRPRSAQIVEQVVGESPIAEEVPGLGLEAPEDSAVTGGFVGAAQRKGQVRGEASWGRVAGAETATPTPARTAPPTATPIQPSAAVPSGTVRERDVELAAAAEKWDEGGELGKDAAAHGDPFSPVGSLEVTPNSQQVSGAAFKDALARQTRGLSVADGEEFAGQDISGGGQPGKPGGAGGVELAEQVREKGGDDHWSFNGLAKNQPAQIGGRKGGPAENNKSFFTRRAKSDGQQQGQGQSGADVLVDGEADELGRLEGVVPGRGSRALSRGKKLAEVESDSFGNRSEAGPSNQSGRGGDRFGRPVDKLDAIIIPKVDFQDVSVEEAVEYLQKEIAKHDESELDPRKKGLKFNLPNAGGEGEGKAELEAEAGLAEIDLSQVRVKDLQLENVPAATALQYLADQTKLRYQVDEQGEVNLSALGSAEADDVVTRTWKVPHHFFESLEQAYSGGSDDADPFAAGESVGGGALKARRSLVERLQEVGISFPEGSTAQFIPSTGTLVVSNTPANLDLVDRLAEDVGSGAADPAPAPEFFARHDMDADEARETWDKLRNIRVPEVEFSDVTVGQAVQLFEDQLRDVRTEDGKRLDLDIRLGGQLAGGGAGAPVDQEKISSLRLRDVPLGTALYSLANEAGLDLEVSNGTVTLERSVKGKDEGLITRSWTVHPEVLDHVVNWYSAVETGDDPFGEAGEQPRPAGDPASLEEVLQDSGIELPDGSSVRYLPESRTLVASNYSRNLELVDTLFRSAAVELTKEQQKEQVLEETVEKRASAEPFSTFSLHVSDVSFKLAKATLDRGEWPEAGQLRVEEFVNAFDYGDPAPSQAEKVACALEQGAHPFLEQRNLLRISMRTAALGRAGGTPLRLTVLLDNSGSMDRVDRIESVRNAFDLLADQLTEADQVTLISFARTPRLLADRLKGNEAAGLSGLVDATPLEGGTNLEAALDLGVEKAREQFLEGGQNRIILLTDGAANLGNAKPEDLTTMVEEMRQQGIAFDACGVGADGLNDEILESLTRKGDGRYYFLDRPEDADAGFAKQIAGALRPAARNVKVQVEFNPDRVGHYKLYGFEKHRLKKEDFRNDSVDAAEMAAEEAGNAIYQVQVLPEGEGDIGSVSVRFQDTSTGRMIEKKWPIPYDPSTPGLAQSAASMRLAACAGLLGEKLNGGPIGELVELGELARLTSSLQGDFSSDPRVRALIDMTNKARELSGE